MLTLKRHARGSADCRYKGKCYWFGKYGTKESNQRFQAWSDSIDAETELNSQTASVSIVALCTAFMQHAKNG